ncbi:Maltose acetyltransferase [Paenibacillus sp. cl141a]|uniref:maltose acetyltransferase domain-containing protein n=1 Tax=Paenibacillus sp. cl141a TaxID=1761877 RepID=UPI0008C6AB7C|nr:maltose acetyltransferase domain-containing protein [Paenibacillus sp. cl141a]SEM68697.1 Maltose acetyltransferase [Paenibacillus sp. cl141a]
MKEEERIFQGKLFAPSHPDLKLIKRSAHNLSHHYSDAYEWQEEERNSILEQLLGRVGKNCYMQGL